MLTSRSDKTGEGIPSPQTLDRPWLRHYPDHVPRHLEYPELPAFALLDRTAARHPELTALVYYDQRQTYAELRDQADRVANALARAGVRKGDRVALMMPNCPQYVASYFGILKAGAVVAQVNPIYVEREIRHIVDDSGATVMLTADLLYPRVKNILGTCALNRIWAAAVHGEIPLGHDAQRWEDVVEAAEPRPPEPGIAPRDDVAVLQYTGGTTGVSKGAMLSHFNLVANVLQTRAWFGREFAPGEEKIMTVLPLFHSYGMTGCMNFALENGSQMVLLPRFDVQEVLEAIKRHQPTAFPGVPTMYVAINQHPRATSYGLSSIRYCNSGAAPLAVEVMREFELKTGAVITEGYGLSEASPVTHINPTRGLRKPGSIGLPVPDTDCRVVDPDTGRDVEPGQPGELWISGPQVMKGYWNMPGESKAALEGGWLRTGDIVRMDEDGYFYVVDRKKDMIIAGGFNIYPRDVEEVLYQHAAVEECCVAGVPHPYRGETVKAYVVLKERQKATPDELKAFCRQHLAAFKAPTEIEIRKTLPKSAVGKILRKNLVEQDRRRQSALRPGQEGPVVPALSVEDVTVSYGPVRVVNQVSFEVLPGELVSIIGANGAGKTTLLKAIAGTLAPDDGRILFHGVELQGRPAHRLARQGLVMVPEGRQIFANLTVWDNLLIGAYPALGGPQRRDRLRRAVELADRFPIIRQRARQMAGTLSGGEQQMLAIARALMANPRVLLLDEPSLGLAPAIVAQLFEIIAGLKRDGTTIVLVEQKALRALQIADWAYVLETGRMSVSGGAADVAANPDVARVYLGHAHGHAV